MKSRSTLATLLRQGLFFGTLAAGLFHLALVVVMGATRTLGDDLVLSLYFTLGAVPGLIVLNLVLGFLLTVIRRTPETRQRFVFGLNLFLVLAVCSSVSFIVALRPFWLGNPGHSMGLLGMLAASAAVAWLLAKTPVVGLTRNTWVALVASLLFFAAPSIAFLQGQQDREELNTSAVQVKERPDHKIMLIGFDGCTWDVLNPLLEAGRLPNFQRMVEQGTTATLMSEMAVNQPFADSASKGMRTPVIWETICSGHHPKQHGIWDFFGTWPRGMEHPIPFRLPIPGPIAYQLGVRTKAVYSTDAREKRYWEILEDFEQNSIVVGWVDTWPAFEMGHCQMVSDRSHYDSRLMTWPEELEREYSWFYRDYATIAKEELGKEFEPDFLQKYLESAEQDPSAKEALESNAEIFREIEQIKEAYYLKTRYKEKALEVLGFELDPEYATKYDREDPLYWEHHLVGLESKDLARDLYYADLAEDLLKEDAKKARAEQARFQAFYFPTTDTVQHWFWKFYEPEAFSHVDAGSVERLGDVIPKVYENADRILGRLLAFADENTTVIIVSDHGAGAWTERESGGVSLFRGGELHVEYSGNHRQNGVLLAMGPGIKKGHKLDNQDIYVVTPLLLHLNGMPLAENMRGTVPEDMFEGSFRQQHPVTTYPDYGPRYIPNYILELLEKGSSGDAAYAARVEQLGYGGDGSEDEEEPGLDE